MRTITNVTKTIDIVLGTGRDLVAVVKRNGEMLRGSVRTYLCLLYTSDAADE